MGSTRVSAPAVQSPSSAAPAAHHGVSEGAKIGIIVGCVVGAVSLAAILVGTCCCLVRRKHRGNRTTTPVEQEEAKSWKSPVTPGRHYQNYTSVQRGNVPVEQHPGVPLMAAVTADSYGPLSKGPIASQHPAVREPKNPFVPVPPTPRRTALTSRSDPTDGMVVDTGPKVMRENERLHKSPSPRSRSRSNSRIQDSHLPTQNDANRPATPFGLNGFGIGTPVDQNIHITNDSAPIYSGIGQPYEDMHVHVLQTDAPSRELRHSIPNREPFPRSINDDQDNSQHEKNRGYSTPSGIPSRSPNREKPSSVPAHNSYESSLSATTASNSSGERYISRYDFFQPTQRESVAPWEQHQNRYFKQQMPAERISAPPDPWEESANHVGQQRRQSQSPRQSVQFSGADGRRRSSRSPATSINGQQRRLRFEDLQAGNYNGRYSTVPGQHDIYDDYNSRWSQGVGEAL